MAEHITPDIAHLGRVAGLAYNRSRFVGAKCWREVAEAVVNALNDADDTAEQERMAAEEADDLRRANPLEPGHRRLDR